MKRVTNSAQHLQYVQTDVPMFINVRVEYGRLESNGGRYIGVTGREREVEFVAETIVGCTIGTGEGGNPIEEIVTNWESGD